MKWLFEKNFRSVFQVQPTREEIDDLWYLNQRKNGTKITPKLLQYINERVEHRGRWVGALQRASVPMMLINGVEDPISGEHMVQRYEKLVPKSRQRVVRLHGVGHYPQTEAPAEVLQHYLTFLKNDARCDFDA